jgi:hypothetical protein
MCLWSQASDVAKNWNIYMHLRRKTRVPATCEAIKCTAQEFAKSHKFLQPMLALTVAEQKDFAVLEIASLLHFDDM